MEGPASAATNTDGPGQLGLEAWQPRLRSGAVEEQGARRSLEDAHCAWDDCEQLAASTARPRGFYAVFDGHSGRESAELARDRLLPEVAAVPHWDRDVPAALAAGLASVDEQLRAAGGTCGTTAIAALLLGTRLTVANVGDCRCVLSRRGRAVELSVDHKPSGTAERERIAAAGGFVDEEGYLCGALGVSRALGDWHAVCARSGRALKAPGAGSPLTAASEVSVTELEEGDEFLIIACDGLWDVISSQNGVALCRTALQKHNDPAQAAAELAREAIDVWHSHDNVTVVVVALQELPPVRRSVSSGALAGRPRVSRAISTEALAGLQRALGSGDG